MDSCVKIHAFHFLPFFADMEYVIIINQAILGSFRTLSTLFITYKVKITHFSERVSDKNVKAPLFLRIAERVSCYLRILFLWEF
ncbi:hypothetical protein J2Z40_003658 [Cytobacillus eiseniae]|uniref:Uncharacterized protein n=1 Tax=Cytobacillus eiseniae TaxID=762947 RepID=A0ABS4RJI7_9BACI|nr:hypothetical protein [Cytobacillus eiseniae]